MNLDQFIEDFNILKKKSWEISAENRKLINAESKAGTTNIQPERYPLLNEKSSPATEGDVKKEQKLLHYTIQQYEDWSLRERNKNDTKDSSDMQDVAKKTYDKELKKLHKDITVRNKFPNDGGIQKLDRNPRTGKLIVKDNYDLVRRLAKDMENTANDRYENRKKNIEKTSLQGLSSGVGYVNEKNKQFNEKLDRRISRSP